MNRSFCSSLEASGLWVCGRIYRIHAVKLFQYRTQDRTLQCAQRSAIWVGKAGDMEQNNGRTDDEQTNRLTDD
jgi:hypothetical protein